MSDAAVVLTIASALGSGIVGGIFFAFSTFVMRALADVPAAHGIGVMQAINLRVINPLFMTAFLGTGLACAAVIAIALADLGEPFAPYAIAAGVLYIAGSIGVTLRANEPRNLALGEMDPRSEETDRYWRDRYLPEWNRLNHLRTIACIVAGGLEIGAVSVG
jgi:uncharacterized membrane protein